MIIKSSSNKCPFDKVPRGGVFKSENVYYIRTWNIIDEDEDEWNAISLDDGCYAAFNGTAEVIPYPNAYLSIE